jgi:hypothetical protein
MSMWTRDQARFREAVTSPLVVGQRKGNRNQILKSCQCRKQVRKFKLRQQAKPTSAAMERMAKARKPKKPESQK